MDGYSLQLRTEILNCLDMIEASIDEVHKECRKRRILSYELRDNHGNWVMIPLVAAKAQCLSTLAQFELSDKNSREKHGM